MAMSKERREQVAIEKTALIREAALTLFDRKGYRETTMEEIAQQAGISKGLIYRYFSSKKEILLSFEQAVEKYALELEKQPSPKESLRLAAEHVLLHEENLCHGPVMQILILCYLQGVFSEEDLTTAYSMKNLGKTVFGPLIQKGQKLGLFRKGDPEAMGDALWHLIVGYAVMEKDTEKEPLTQKKIEEMLSLFDSTSSKCTKSS